MSDDLQVLDEPKDNDEERLAEETLLGGKFKTVEALSKSYQELEREFGVRTSRLKALEGAEERVAELEQILGEMQTRAEQNDVAALRQTHQFQLAQAAQVANAAARQASQLVAAQTFGQQPTPTDPKVLRGIVDQRMAQKLGPVWQEWRPFVERELVALLPEQVTLPELERAYDAGLKIVERNVYERELLQRQRADEKMAAQTVSGAGGRPLPPDSDEEFADRLVRVHRGGSWANRRS